ncbi:MAG TPA: hypothetical protein VL972_03775 [Solirubrobacteraceae bacterium]|nr:hypothetical protein [Solirubrobacteraceae bacterium]
MATRSIVTSQPDIACDVCGRRLLRGERPDVFIAGGRRREVCELCAPRAIDEGWLRESDRHSVTLPPARRRRTRGLLGRLRQLREPAGEESVVLAAREDGSFSGAPRAGARGRARAGAGTAIGDESFFEEGLDDPALAKAAFVPDLPAAHIQPVPALAPQEAQPEALDPAGAVALAGELAHAGAPTATGGEETAPAEPLQGGDLKMERALEVFNAGPHPRRIAGISRSLGTPEASVRPLAESGGAVAVVVAWELCWYRYELDLGDEAAGVSVAAEGSELGELSGEDRLQNATMGEDGRLSLVAFAGQ